MLDAEVGQNLIGVSFEKLECVGLDRLDRRDRDPSVGEAPGGHRPTVDQGDRAEDAVVGDDASVAAGDRAAVDSPGEDGVEAAEQPGRRPPQRVSMVRW